MYRIYAIHNRLNGKVYVGLTQQSVRRRFQSHLDNARLSKSGWLSLLGQALLTHGREHFWVETLATKSTKQEGEEAEILWIEHFNCYAPNGYNLREGGGSKGHHAESTKQKMRGKQFSKSTREKISSALQGTPRSDKAKAALADGRKVAWTEERRVKDRGEGNPNARLTEPDVIVIRKRYASGEFSQQQLADQFHVKQVTISAIISRRSWKHLPEDY